MDGLFTYVKRQKWSVLKWLQQAFDSALFDTNNTHIQMHLQMFLPKLFLGKMEVASSQHIQNIWLYNTEINNNGPEKTALQQGGPPHLVTTRGISHTHCRAQSSLPFIVQVLSVFDRRNGLHHWCLSWHLHPIIILWHFYQNTGTDTHMHVQTKA